ncbi:hypothetical protein A3L11_01415 [Thermococcus siculi]|uniref:Uncharacterized protein n=1 Tax=Thermococcus siculi TaxID=72803 RepID=A0A2Z2MK11_9EURY|nr:hypothetical protein [Thermococcus siculi]ASJ07955.1 hypothetical protein A3L11_01415 [Thermococcus siculi]
MKMETKTLVSSLVLLLLLGAGCIGSPERSGTSTPTIFPGYGEFNAGNVLVGDGEVVRNYYGLVVPQNRTVVLRGFVFSKEYAVSSTGGNTTTGYYSGRVRLRAYLADIVVSYAWNGLEPRLKPVSELKVEITPETVDVEPGKNTTFEIRIDTSSAVPGKTYYLYIVAFGEDGWKGWAVVEITIGNTTLKSS